MLPAVNGIHDMGGMHGFGRVVVEPNEPVFHHRWEARVFGMVQSLAGGNIDAGRHSLERLGPVAYLENGYYGRWLAAFERTLTNVGVLGASEVADRMEALRAAPAAVRPAVASAHWTPQATRYVREVADSPRFAVGDAVRTRNHQPSGHTRLPAYVRTRRGTVRAIHAAMVFPDDHAHGRGENPQHLYTVRFDAAELFGDGAEPGAVVHVDLFEPYLEPIR
jgi:nitrile hydratase beta subunit